MQWYVAFVATILAHIRVKPGTANRFEDVARKLYAETHANESRVRRYEYWRGSEENTYYTLLSFDSFVGFMEHQTSDHHESASPSLGPPTIDRPRDVMSATDDSSSGWSNHPRLTIENGCIAGPP